MPASHTGGGQSAAGCCQLEPCAALSACRSVYLGSVGRLSCSPAATHCRCTSRLPPCDTRASWCAGPLPQRRPTSGDVVAVGDGQVGTKQHTFELKGGETVLYRCGPPWSRWAACLHLAACTVLSFRSRSVACARRRSWHVAALQGWQCLPRSWSCGARLLVHPAPDPPLLHPSAPFSDPPRLGAASLALGPRSWRWAASRTS